jgi:NADPH:quinone reductase-like Zn-dependent oxidoreductase
MKAAVTTGAGITVVQVPDPYADGPSGPEGLGLSPVLSGAFAERMVLQESLLLPVPDGVPDDQAALTEPLTEPLAVGLDGVARAFDDLREPGHHVKIIVQP